MENITDKIASEHLGKKVSGSETYNPNLLVAVPREENRKHYNIDSSALPFWGYDVWHAYEFSSLTENSVPTTRLIKLKYNCNNEFLVESKSLKLYLNSYNMSKYGKDTNECLEICKNQIIKDLSKKLKTEVELEFLDNSSNRQEIYNDFKNIMEFVDETDLKIENFKESPEVLKIEDTAEEKEYKLTFDSLRSNCRVTHQPDFGDAFILYKSKKHIKEDSLVKYLTSFRSEYHFHEECCEMIFKRLYDVLGEDSKIFVSILYTRRGGIDISPTRISNNFNIKEQEALWDLTTFARCGIKQ